MNRAWFDFAIRACLVATIIFQSYAIRELDATNRSASASMQRLFHADDELKAADARLQKAVAWCQGGWH